jgi:hypothetical protein
MRFRLTGDEYVFVEVDPDEPAIAPVSRVGDVIESATDSFAAALSHVRTAASIALASFREMEADPDQVEIEFGVKLNAEAGAIVAKTGAEGHLRVALRWQRATPAA